MMCCCVAQPGCVCCLWLSKVDACASELLATRACYCSMLLLHLQLLQHLRLSCHCNQALICAQAAKLDLRSIGNTVLQADFQEQTEQQCDNMQGTCMGAVSMVSMIIATALLALSGYTLLCNHLCVLFMSQYSNNSLAEPPWCLFWATGLQRSRSGRQSAYCTLLSCLVRNT